MRKINIGNDQAKWRKTLGKTIRKLELKKTEQKKKQPKDHPKKMVWYDRESKLPVVILDECVFSSELQDKVSGLGFNVMYLGSGLPDESIRAYMKVNPNTVIITSDVEFSEWFTWKQCFLIEQKTPEHEVAGLINEFMWIHKEEVK